MSETTETAQRVAGHDASAADSSHDVEAFRTEYGKSTQQAQAKAASAYAEAENRYQMAIKEIAHNAERAWIESYESYLSAYKSVPQNPDDEALDAVRNAWAAHVAACAWAPELVEAWNAAYQKLVGELQEIEFSFADALRGTAENYSRNLRASVSAHGLDNLDLAAVEFVAERMAAIRAASAS